MAIKHKSLNRRYIKTEDDFVSCKMRASGHRRIITFKFKLYIDLVSALLDGLNKIEVTLTDRGKFTLPYLGEDKDPAHISRDIQNFYGRTIDALVVKEGFEDLYSQVYTVEQFLNDNLVSQISSGVITKRNYKSFLPKYNVFMVNDTANKTSENSKAQTIITSHLSTGSINTTKTDNTLAELAFEQHGYDPAYVSRIEYPACSKECQIQGVRDNIINPPQEIIPPPAHPQANCPTTFYELYAKLIKATEQSPLSSQLIEKSVRLRYIPVNLTIRLNVHRSEYNTIIKKKKLMLDLTFLNEDDDPVTTTTLTWDNEVQWQKLKARYRDPRLTVTAGDPKLVEPDKFRIFNSNNFNLIVHLVEMASIDNEISFKSIWSGNINRKSTKRLDDVGTIFGNSSQSRSYRLYAARNIASGLFPCNYCSIAVVSTAEEVSYDSSYPSLLAVSTDDGIDLQVSGLPKNVDFIKIYRTEISERYQGRPIRPAFSTAANIRGPMGILEKIEWTKILAGTISDYTGKIPDAGIPSIISGQVYLYEAECFSEGAKLNYKLSAMAVNRMGSDIANRIKFSVNNVNSSSTSTSVTHSFSIGESVIATPAESLLDEANKSGQASVYSDEIESEKTDTSVLARYKIVRINITRSTEETVESEAIADTQYEFTLDTYIEDAYKYRVELLGLEAAALSYETVVTDVDDDSGQSYSYRYRKWRGQGTKDKEKLPGVNEINRNDLNLSLEEAIAGSTQSISFSATLTIPKIKNVYASMDEANFCNWVSWEVTGEVNEINHFLILASYNGVEAPIGAAHPQEDGVEGGFTYKDKRLFGLLGEVSYRIVIVRSNFMYDYSADPVTVIKNSEIPTFAFL